MDAYSQPKLYNTAAMGWLCFRLDALSSLIFAFSLIFLINLPTGLIDPGIMSILDKCIVLLNGWYSLRLKPLVVLAFLDT